VGLEPKRILTRSAPPSRAVPVSMWQVFSSQLQAPRCPFYMWS
jgi:hypothetical protein